MDCNPTTQATHPTGNSSRRRGLRIVAFLGTWLASLVLLVMPLAVVERATNHTTAGQPLGIAIVETSSKTISPVPPRRHRSPTVTASAAAEATLASDHGHHHAQPTLESLPAHASRKRRMESLPRAPIARAPPVANTTVVVRVSWTKAHGCGSTAWLGPQAERGAGPPGW